MNATEVWSYVEMHNGGLALLDDADLPTIEGYTWRWRKFGRRSVYVVAYRDDRDVLMHRLLMRPGPGLLVDHLNGNGLDNRRSNLRVCSRAGNQMNQHAHVGASSRFKGVHWHKQRGKWVASIGANGSSRHLGLFEREEDAARAYDAAALQLHGEFARTNFAPGLPVGELPGGGGR